MPARKPVRPEEASDREPSGTRSRTPARPLDWLVAIAVVLTAMHRLNLPGQNVLVADAVLGLVVVTGVVTVVKGSSRAAALAQRLLPWLWLYVLAHLLGMFNSGIQVWALDTTVRNVFPILFFLGALAILERSPRALTIAHYALLGTAAIVVSAMLGDGSVRPSGTFTNPGYAGYFLAAVAVYVLATPGRAPVRAAMLTTCVFGLYLTASFGAVVLLAAGGAYLLWGVAQRFPREARVCSRLAIGSSLVILFGLAATQGTELLPADEAESPLSQQRLDRSADSRFELWSGVLVIAPEHPLGTGPGLVQHDRPDDLKANFHNDYLTFLTETGLIGLAALGLIIVQIWRSAPQGSAARAIIASYAVAAALRDTVNFRHQWVILAIALVTAWRTQARQRQDC